ncbi:hypothetical protein PG984_011296 [Apiospora sp. TS-2023a]
MDGRDDFLYRADPILLGMQKETQSLLAKPQRTGLEDLLARLGKGSIDCVDMANEIDNLVARGMQAPRKHPKTSNKKGKKRKGKKAKKAAKAKKFRLALSDGVIKYAESVQALCNNLEADD